MKPEQSTLSADSVPSAEQFLRQAGDEDVLRFLRRLPIFAGQEDGRITLSDLIFEMQLWPYVKSAWSEVEGSPGIPGRLLQLTRVYKTAEADFEKETGKTRRLPRVIDLPAFIDVYSTEGLP